MTTLMTRMLKTITDNNINVNLILSQDKFREHNMLSIMKLKKIAEKRNILKDMYIEYAAFPNWG